MVAGGDPPSEIMTLRPFLILMWLLPTCFVVAGLFAWVLLNLHTFLHS